jgi:hypothetical protein
MALLSPQQGEQQLMNDLLSSGENWILKLYTSGQTPSSTDTPATYTEVNSTTNSWYSSKTITRTVTASTWSSPTLATPSVSYYNSGSGVVWSATTAVTLTGYFVVGNTSGKLIFAEKFASSIGLVNPSTFTLYPQFSLT